MENVNLCKICQANIIELMSSNGTTNKINLLESSSDNCAFCFGLLCDEELHEQIADGSLKKFLLEKFDGNTFILAINMPITQIFRETILQKLFDYGRWAPGSMSPKELLSCCLMGKIAEKTKLRPTLNSDLILTVSFENDEFMETDFNFALLNFPNEFTNSTNKKRRKLKNENNTDKNHINANSDLTQLLTKVKVRSLSMTNEIAR
ncbi:unnamed protein product [Meloidogyne enterolobii]|uniref:Uncharacterized protein n=1 Tax=Meloidogyne enterolobii TaxID=390850 RepID=A0ACB0XNY0_MELEN